MVAERELVLARVVQLDIAVGLGEDVDEDRLALLLGEEVLVVVEGVVLQLRLGEVEKLRDRDELGALAADLELEVRVLRTAVVRLRAVDRGLDLNTDVERF